MYYLTQKWKWTPGIKKNLLRFLSMKDWYYNQCNHLISRVCLLWAGATLQKRQVQCPIKQIQSEYLFIHYFWKQNYQISTREKDELI